MTTSRLATDTCPVCLSYWLGCTCKDPFLPGHVEDDPNGISQHSPGAKLDKGKIDAELVFEGFPRALLAVAEVATFGALKYSRGGWKSVANGIQRYDAAHMRHKLKRLSGELWDPESTFRHRAHEVWNALAALELELKLMEEKID